MFSFTRPIGRMHYFGLMIAYGIIGAIATYGADKGITWAAQNHGVQGAYTAFAGVAALMLFAVYIHVLAIWQRWADLEPLGWSRIWPIFATIVAVGFVLATIAIALVWEITPEAEKGLEAGERFLTLVPHILFLFVAGKLAKDDAAVRAARKERRRLEDEQIKASLDIQRQKDAHARLHGVHS